MTIKYQIDSVDGLPAEIAELYTKVGDVYRLAVDGLPASDDAEALKRKNSELIAEKREMQKKATEAAEEARRLADEAAKKSGDVETVTEHWRQRLAAREAELAAEVAKRTNALESVMSITTKSIAAKLASELAVEGGAKLLEDHVLRRLAISEIDGQYKTVVVDDAGKPTALTVEDLKKEMASNPAYACVIAGSRATGGGATGGAGGGASNVDIMKLPPVERMNAARKQG